jgi:hypothetical protein
LRSRQFLQQFHGSGRFDNTIETARDHTRADTRTHACPDAGPFPGTAAGLGTGLSI